VGDRYPRVGDRYPPRASANPEHGVGRKGLNPHGQCVRCPDTHRTPTGLTQDSLRTHTGHALGTLRTHTGYTPNTHQAPRLAARVLAGYRSHPAATSIHMECAGGIGHAGQPLFSSQFSTLRSGKSEKPIQHLADDLRIQRPISGARRETFIPRFRESEISRFRETEIPRNRNSEKPTRWESDKIGNRKPKTPKRPRKIQKAPTPKKTQGTQKNPGHPNAPVCRCRRWV
jgi:hypothetical protein